MSDTQTPNKSFRMGGSDDTTESFRKKVTENVTSFVSKSNEYLLTTVD